MQNNGWLTVIKTSRRRQIGHHFANIFKCVFLNEKVLFLIDISLKFVLVLEGQINNIPVLVQIMDWRWQGDKPLYAPMIFSLFTHRFVTWLQWVNGYRVLQSYWGDSPLNFMSVSVTSENHLHINSQILTWYFDISPMRSSGIVTSHSPIVLACINWFKVWLSAVNIDLPQPSIHSAACKK